MNGALSAVELDVRGQRIAGIRHHDAARATQRVLCLHGWLDNAASFVPLMPHLPGLDLVAIDLPGHGRSAHPAHCRDNGYTLFDSVTCVHGVLDALGWERCHLLGHSMGGCIAPVLAVAAPERIERLMLLDASGPLSESADALPARLTRALQDRVSAGRFASRTFSDIDQAIDARLKAATMTRGAARLIVERQLVAVDGGWRWCFDPALRYASWQYQTEPQVRAVLQSVACPTLTVVAEHGFLAGRADTEARLACLAGRHAVSLPGHHHVHMDTPEPVAAAINRFLGTRPALGD